MRRENKAWLTSNHYLKITRIPRMLRPGRERDRRRIFRDNRRASRSEVLTDFYGNAIRVIEARD